MNFLSHRPGAEGPEIASPALAKHMRLPICVVHVNLVRIHECLCDRTRLRIVHLLLHGPLCVCHIQKVLGAAQAKVSRHLAYLRRSGMAQAERNGKWIVYRLPVRRPAALETNLACLQDCAREEKIFRDDLRRLRRLQDCPERLVAAARRLR